MSPNKLTDTQGQSAVLALSGGGQQHQLRVGKFVR